MTGHEGTPPLWYVPQDTPTTPQGRGGGHDVQPAEEDKQVAAAPMRRGANERGASPRTAGSGSATHRPSC